jgi:hypothetical protein
MISSLYKNQVRILAQQEGTTVANEPEYDPMGIGIEGLLKSELYGLRSTLAPEILEKLDRHYFLLGKEDKTDQEQSELMQIAQELNEMGVSRTHPNPYFDQFASAMARQTPTPDVELTKNEIAEQTKLADEILDEILAEEKESQGDEKQ